MKYSKEFIEKLTNELTNMICYDEKLTDEEGYFKEEKVFEAIKKKLNIYL